MTQSSCSYLHRSAKDQTSSNSSTDGGKSYEASSLVYHLWQQKARIESVHFLQGQGPCWVACVPLESLKYIHISTTMIWLSIFQSPGIHVVSLHVGFSFYSIMLRYFKLWGDIHFQIVLKHKLINIEWTWPNTPGAGTSNAVIFSIQHQRNSVGTRKHILRFSPNWPHIPELLLLHGKAHV